MLLAYRRRQCLDRLFQTDTAVAVGVPLGLFVLDRLVVVVEAVVCSAEEDLVVLVGRIPGRSTGYPALPPQIRT